MEDTYIWIRYADQWVIGVPANKRRPYSQVSVRRKNGTCSYETLGKCIPGVRRVVDGVAYRLYRYEPKPPQMKHYRSRESGLQYNSLMLALMRPLKHHGY